MTTFEFLSYLRSLDVKVWAEGDKLRYQALESALLPSLKAELAQRKSDILQVLGELKTNAHPARLSIRPIAERHQSPLSFSQQRLWFLNQLEPDSSFYTELAAVRMKGRLDVPVLERALSEIIRRHEAVRTIFPTIDGHPTQLIQPAHFLKLQIDDLSLLPQDERELEIRQLIKAEAQRPFDLAQGPLMRVRLLRLSLNEYVMVAPMHHIITDGWSMGVLVREVGALYQAFASGKPSPLAELPIQYADYASWQRQWMSGEVLESQLRYWRQQLGGELPVLDLPTDRPRPAKQSFSGARHTVALGLELSRNLEVMSREQGVTLFMTLLATFQILLHRYTSQTDVRVGSPVANRTRAETEELIGLFVNTLVLRADLSGNPSFCELLGRVRETALGAYAHQELPFEKLVEELNPERDLSYTPLFQVMFVLQNAPMPALELSGLELTQIEIEPGTSKFDLEFALVETAEGLTGWMEYNTALFEGETIERLIGHYLNVLDGIVKDRERPIGWLNLLSEGERKQIVEEWNATEATYGKERLIHELFEEQVKRSPETVALSYEEQSLSYEELNRRANRLAHHLRDLGVGPEVRVGICVERSVEMVVALLATLKSGGAYVPLDPDYPGERLAYMVEESRPAVLLTHGAARRALTGSWQSAPILDLESDEERWGGQSEQNPERSDEGSDARSLAYIIYTSGSTGLPKGAMNEHGGVVNRLKWMQEAYDLGVGEAVLQKTPYSFDVSVWEFFWSLLNGGRLVMARPGGHRDPTYLARKIREQEISTAHFVPSMLQVFLEQPEAGDCRELRRVICSGEALPAPLSRRFYERLPETELHNLYGPTEAAVDVTAWNCEEKSSGKGIPIGRPVSNTRIYILDEEWRPTPMGVAGGIYIGGAQVGRGYDDRAEMTAERFLPDPFSREAGGRMYKTGDVGRWLREGAIEFLGRNDWQVKIRGFRIELGEIEARLREMAEVREAVVVAREEREVGKSLVAYVVPSTGCSVDPGALRQRLAQVLPDYMAPAAILELDALPLTPNGKLDRKRLPEPELSLAGAWRAPRNPQEEILCSLFAEVLGLERVGLDDDFFKLGGHSLMATRLVSQIRAVLGVQLAIPMLFESPTVGELSGRLRECSEGRARLAPQQRPEHAPLSYAQQRLWFLDRLEGASTEYNMPRALRLRGELDQEALESTINTIVERHESLRTRFAEVDGKPVQVIEREMRIEAAVEDLSALDEETRVGRVDAALRREWEEPFDLGRGPLLRMKLLRLSERDHILIRTMHHIVSDGWSEEVFNREFALLYEAYREGRENPLRPLGLQYADFALWQRGWLDEERLGGGIEYWKQQLAGIPERLELPADRPRPPMRTFGAEASYMTLNAEQSAGLRRLSQSNRATLYMTLLAGFGVLLGRYSGQKEIVVGTPIANRQEAQLEELIGFFVNTLVMRLKVEREKSFGELLGEVRRVALEAYQHQDVPFERLVEKLSPPRSLNTTPLFQVLFAVQNAPRVEQQMKELEVELVVGDELQVRFDLEAHVWERGEEMGVYWLYNRDLFDRWRMEQMARHYAHVLEAMASDASQAVGGVDLLEESERRQIVEEWNETAREMPEATLAELFEEQARRTPDAVAVVFAEESLTYRELGNRASDLAYYLIGRGVGAEVVVGVCMERSLEMMVAVLGVLKAGGSYLPLDVSYPKERLGLMVEDCGISVLLTQRRAVEGLTSAKAEVVFLDSDWRQECEQRVEIGNQNKAAGADNLAYVIYTSGSTGRPKGVAMPHRPLVNLFVWQREELGLTPEPRTLQFSPLSFDASANEAFTTWIMGGRLVIAPEELRRDAAALVEFLIEEGIDTLFPPFVLLQQIADECERRREYPRLRQVMSTAEPLQITESVARFFKQLENCRLHNEYGPSETHVVTAYGMRGEVDGWPALPPIGTPIANTRMYVLDEWYQAAPVGVAGELYIAGENLARGYVNRGELTAERFVPNPMSGAVGERLYRTGDLAVYLPDGNLRCLGRTDQQIKVRGYRIEPGEIEAELLSHPEVEQAVVVARAGRGGEKRLVGYVVAAPGHSVDSKALRQKLAQRLPEYMTPVAIIGLAELPLTPSGKLDRRGLPEPELSSASAWRAPRNPKEEILCSLFAEVLGLERVGLDDNFFELGGHSLLATQVISRVKNSLGVEIGVKSLFEEGTVEGLAGRIEEAMRAGAKMEAPPLCRALREGSLPLSFAQQRLWFIEQLEPGKVVYNLPGALRLEGRLNLEALERSVNEIVRRHEVLRTRIEMEAGEPVQVIDEWEPRRLEIADLSGLGKKEKEEAVGRIGKEEVERQFDLRRGPLIRVKVLKLEEEEHVLLFAMHHIVSDGWSMGILSREVGALYQAYRSGEESPLEELPIQYADFAVWQREWLKGEVLEKGLEYWRRQLAGMENLALPTDHPRPAAPSYRGASQHFVVERELTEKLRALGQQEGVTLFMILLGVFDVVMSRYSGQEDVALGTDIANRNRAEVEGLVGFFVNQLVLRVQIRGEESFRELLKRVREVCLGAYMHQDAPFEKLVSVLKPERAAEYTPLFQAKIVLQNVAFSMPELYDLTSSGFSLDHSPAENDLILNITETYQGLMATLLYNADLYEASTVEQLLKNFEIILRLVTEQADIQLSALGEQLAKAEKQQLLLRQGEFKAARRKMRENINVKHKARRNEPQS